MKYEKRIEIRVSSKDVALIRKKMKEADVRNMSAFIRKMAIDGYVIHLDFSDLKEAVRLLRYCSNNLNQYAKKANESGSIYGRDVRDIQKRFEDIWTMLNELMVKYTEIS